MRAEIFWINDIQNGRLAILPRPRGGDWLEDEVQSLKQAGVDVLVSLLTTEEEDELDLTRESACCAAGGICFVSFPINDRGVPESFQDFLELVRSLALLVTEGKGVAVHCRQGVGRSGLVAACILVSLGEKPPIAFDRIGMARGCPVPDTEEQRIWVTRLADKYSDEGQG